MKFTLAWINLSVATLLPTLEQPLNFKSSDPARTEPPAQVCQSNESERPIVNNAVTGHPIGFERALFEITLEGKQGFIDQHGDIVIEPKYEKVLPFHEGLAAVQVDQKWGFIDSQDRMLIEPQFIQVGSFADGLAPVKLHRATSRWGFIDLKGNLVIEPQFDHVENFRNGIAKVGMVARDSILLSLIADIGPALDYHYIDRTGHEVREPRPEHYTTGKPNELISFRQDGLFGFVDADGNIIIKPQFVAASEFTDGLACVCRERLFGYIDRTGEFVIPPRFQYANEFAEGLAGVQIEEGKWGFIDQTGKLVLAANYNWVNRGFRQGLAQVVVAGQTRYINKLGELIW
ncbi:MAG: WG repeat-containing protein [Planctomycetaceae bacterium]|nr:WG repeat-containing protein [Planctomycetaceae bacterium]